MKKSEKKPKTKTEKTIWHKAPQNPPSATLEKATSQKNPPPTDFAKTNKKFPNKFPFWARLKISKRRTTLVIDEEIGRSRHKEEELFVHREATHTNGKNVEKIYPNPDPTDPDPMYLKRPRKHPKRLFEPHNKQLNMPKELQKRYEKNNKNK